LVRVRFAPSPTGKLHIGSARTALFNWLFARKEKGNFILRIEDTDRKRSSEESLKAILEDLKWLGLDWDEGPLVGGDKGPYFQSQRLDIYTKYANKLLEEGKAYLCFCSEKMLEEERKKAILDKKKLSGYQGRCRSLSCKQVESFLKQGKKYVVRFKIPPGTTFVEDLIRGKVEFDNSLIEDFVIVKADGMPVYNFAVVIDDALMEVTHIIRGEEHLSNTPKQLLLYNALDFSPPKFAHIPIILDTQRRKLSKRFGDIDLGSFRKAGFLPEALFNYLALLGWSSGEDKDIYSKEELIEKFSLQRIVKHSAIFDRQKLEWINGHYIHNKPTEEKISLGKNYLISNKIIIEETLNQNLKWWENLILLHIDRVRVLSELIEEIKFYFTPQIDIPDNDWEKYKKEPYLIPAFTNILTLIEQYPSLTKNEYEQIIRGVAKELGVKASAIIHPLRLALSGKKATPGLFEVMELLGKEKIKERIKKVI